MSAMSFWLDLSHFSFEVPEGLDAQECSRRASIFATEVVDRVTRCFAGSAWLRQRFPARSYVQVRLQAHDKAAVSVEHLTIVNFPEEGATGPQEISCDLRVPTAWFTDPGHGLIGLRFFQAVLYAFHTIGERYDIGIPAAIGPTSDRGNPEVRDRFRPPAPPAPPQYAEINTHLERLAAELQPEQLLVAVKEPVPPAVARQCRAVQEALGEVVDQHTLTGPGVKATAWTIQTRP
jgi:hypothetical protein